jgi:hypothetical protein
MRGGRTSINPSIPLGIRHRGRRTGVVIALSVLLPTITVGPAMADGNDPSVRGPRKPVAAAPVKPAQPAAQPADAAAPDSVDSGQAVMIAQLPAPEEMLPNLVRNGSFEDPNSPRSGFVGTFASIPGWTETTGRGIEIQNRLFPPPPNGGSQYAEMASDGPSSFYQDVPTQPGVHYRLTFRYSPHPNTAASVNPFDVTFGQNTMSVAPAASSDVDWKTTVLEITAEGPTTRLTFTDSAADTDHGLGAFLDMIEVRRIN